MFRPWIAVVAVGWFALAGSARAEELPADLSLVPGNAVGFLHLKVPELLRAAPPEARWAFEGNTPAEWAAFQDKFAFKADDLDRVLIFVPDLNSFAMVGKGDPMARSMLFAVTFKKPFDPEPLSKSVFPTARPKQYRGKTFLFDDDPWSAVYVLPGNQTIVIGSEEAIYGVIDRLEAKPEDGPMRELLSEAMSHTVTFAVNSVLAPPGLPEPFASLAKARRGIVTLDITAKDVSIAARLDYPDGKSAEAGAEAVKAAITLGRNAMQPGFQKLRETMDRPVPGGEKLGPTEFPERFLAFLGFGALRQFDKVLQNLPIETKNNSVSTKIKDIPISSSAWVVMAVAGITALGSNANSTFRMVGQPLAPRPEDETPEAKRLKQIAKAINAYHAEKGHYPPPAIISKEGKPLHSWRVAILPYLGENEKALHKQFKLDEPWDSPANKRLLAKMPEVFAKPTMFPTNHGRTTSVAIAGPGTIFDPKATVKKEDLAENGSKTILAIEVGNPDAPKVWWSKPADETFAAGKLPDLFDKYRNRWTWVVFADGTTHALSKDDEKALRRMILRSGKSDE